MVGRFLTAVTGLPVGAHACWPFAGSRELTETAARYAVEGFERRERVTFVDVGATEVFADAVGRIDPDGRHTAEGRLRVITPPARASAVAPARALDQAATAVAEGYTGLRMMTNATAAVRSPEARAEVARYEHRLDRAVHEAPLTVVCGYDTTALPDPEIAELACLHGFARLRASPFLVRALPTPGHLALCGEVDTLCAADLERAVGTCDPGPDGGPVARLTVDLSELEFVDHRALLALGRAAAHLGATVHLSAADELVRWLVDALDVTQLSAEPA